jgi:hypothetical protein
MHAIKNTSLKKLLTIFSLNFPWFPIWYLKSPPDKYSSPRYILSLSYRAKIIFTIKLLLIYNSCFIYARSCLSFFTVYTLFLYITLFFSISLRAYILSLYLTFHTVLNPPFPVKLIIIILKPIIYIYSNKSIFIFSMLVDYLVVMLVIVLFLRFYKKLARLLYFG